MAHIKIGRDTNGNKTATLVTSVGSFTKQVNTTGEMGSAFHGFYRGDKIIIGDLHGLKAAQAFLNHYKEYGTEKQKRIVAAAGG
jgi:hypothetical protein